jgi:alkylation response protein AidB-like acyl-CoA dehydrogenase
METFKKMTDLGFTGVGFPEEYGGSVSDDLCKI